MSNNENGKKKKRGRPVSHAAYSLMVRVGEAPQNRPYLKQYLTETREGLIHDLGPTEADLTCAERVILDRAVSKLCILRCIEIWIAENGVFKGNELSPVLGKNYITFAESLRRDLLTLGITRRTSDRALDITSYIAEFDDKMAREVGKPEEEEGNEAT